MSENLRKQEPTGHPEFERQDLGAKGVLWFLTGLAVFLLVVHFVLTGAYGWLDRYWAGHQPQQNPLVAAQPTDTRTVVPDDAKKFPEPRLETAETSELRDGRRKEEDTLHSYGWVDEKAGVVRLPIDRAMQLTVERGLPTRPAQTLPAGGSTAKEKMAAK